MLIIPMRRVKKAARHAAVKELLKAGVKTPKRIKEVLEKVGISASLPTIYNDLRVLGPHSKRKSLVP